MKKTNRPAVALGLILAAALSGCASAPKEIDVDLRASATVNPDNLGRASPVEVAVYLLKKPDRIAQIDYFELADKWQQALGDDVIKRETATLSPSGSKKIVFPVKPGDQSIAVIASYRDIDKSTWRAVIPVPESGAVTANVDRLAVRLQPAAN